MTCDRCGDRIDPGDARTDDPTVLCYDCRTRSTFGNGVPE